MKRLVLFFLMTRTFFSLSSLLGQDPTRFENEIRAYERADQASSPAPHSIIFAGSSSIRMWSNLASSFPTYPVVNRGFGGSTMPDLLHYFDRLIAVHNPALVVVYEGDNDLAQGSSVEETAKQFREFIHRMKIQLPSSDFAFLSIKPSPSRMDLIPQMIALNTLLNEMTIAEGGYYFDVFTPMLDENDLPFAQLFLSDMLHLNKAGYRLWRLTVTPMLDQWAMDRAARKYFSTYDFKDGVLHLEWEENSTLETSDKPTGPWTTVDIKTPGQHSEPTNESKKFFRIR